MSSKYLVGLIGEGIEHSLTPDLHMREARELGLEYEYRLIDLLESPLSKLSIDQVVEQAIETGYAAINVTHPFKQQVLRLLASSSDEVSQIKASNLVLKLQGDSHGENTDWSGFLFALKQAIPDAARKRVLQVGAGGAGAATAFALLRWGVEELLIADIDSNRSFDLARSYRKLFPNAEIRVVEIASALKQMRFMDGVVQATPIGMHSHPGIPFPIDDLGIQAWVADVIYRPIETEFLRNARVSGHVVVPGNLMALGQAVDSLRLITGLEPNISRMSCHFDELLEDESALTRARGI